MERLSAFDADGTERCSRSRLGRSRPSQSTTSSNALATYAIEASKSTQKGSFVLQRLVDKKEAIASRLEAIAIIGPAPRWHVCT